VTGDRIARKEFYSIGEAADLTGVKPHVLRYWETQFRLLNPRKTSGGSRVYRRPDIQLLQLIAFLLHTERYTVEGAAAKIEQMRREGRLPRARGVAWDRTMIEKLRREADDLLDLLDQVQRAAPPESGPAEQETG